MKIQKNNTGIIITKTAKQPSAKIEFSLDELDALSEFCERQRIPCRKSSSCDARNSGFQRWGSNNIQRY